MIPSQGGAIPQAIDCRHFVELVTAYLENALDEETTQLLDAHLDLCHPCIVYVEQMRDTVATLGRVPMGSLPAHVKSALLDALRASAAKRTSAS